MVSKPSKPINYWRDLAVILVLGMIPMPIAIYFDVKFILPLLPIFIVVVLEQYWFRSYYSDKRAYAKCETKVIKPPIESNQNVNENIARFIEAQRIRRDNAKWWQFWL